MGTRADFYVGTGRSAEWLGSIAMDGHPDTHARPLLRASSEEEFRSAVSAILERESFMATTPDQGWPWPWDDSRTTDFAYSWGDGETVVACFGACERGPAVADSEDRLQALRRRLYAAVKAGDAEAEEQIRGELDAMPQLFEGQADAVFPNMSDRKAVAEPGSSRSGAMVIGVKG